MFYSSFTFYLVACGFALAALAKLLSIGHRPKGLPPGPPTVPILGNIHLMPKRDAHLQFQKWAQEYGPIYSLILGTKTLIVISSDTAVKELLDKRSAIYSDRQPMYMSMDLVSGGLRFLFMRYGPTWRMLRKMVHNILNIVAAKSYVPYQDLENKQMLMGLLDQPLAFMDHIKRYSNSLTTQMVFGFRTSSIDDPKLKQLFHGVEKWSEVSGSGVAVIIDLFPIFKYLPDFMLPMRSYCKDLHEKERDLYVGHWLNAKKAIKAGTAKVCTHFHGGPTTYRFSTEVLKAQQPCFCVDLVKAQDVEGFSDGLAGYTSGSLLEAGSGTTTSTLFAFMQALVLYPNVQKLAQEELDRVVGSDRLPTMEDEMDLQYIRGCVKESMRWMPTAVMGVPHAVTRDDWYDGYLIPKGAGVVNNVWTIHRDPNRYANPQDFDPSRYAEDFQTAKDATTNPDVSKRDHFLFGTGRRVCQGMHIAERSLFLAMSRILWAFNTEAATDLDGNKIVPDPAKLTQGLLVELLPFPAKITPRSERHVKVVREQWDKCLSLLDEDMQWKEVPRGMRLSTYDATKS